LFQTLEQFYVSSVVDIRGCPACLHIIDTMSHSSPTEWNASQPGINIFHHFPKEFVRPYGLATIDRVTGTSDHIKERITSDNTEWLLRPGIAMSEYHETITMNWERVQQDLILLADPTLMRSVENDLQHLTQLTSCSSKDKSSHFNDAEIVNSLQAVSDKLRNMDEVLDSYTDEMFHVGASLFLMTVHWKVAKHILNNLPETATKCSADQHLQNFRKMKTLQTYAQAAGQDLQQ